MEVSQGSYDDPALASRVCARVHQTLEPLWQIRWPLVASRRDLHQGTRRMDLSLSGGGQGWVDCRLQAQSDIRRSRSKSLLQKAIWHESRPPHTITLDGYRASHRAVREMRTDGLLSKRTRLRSSKYLNNLIQQDHRGIRARTRPMLGFKNFSSVAITIAGVELLRRIHKEQFSLSRFRLKDQAAPARWNAVLAA